MMPIEEPRYLAPVIIYWTHEMMRTAMHFIASNVARDCPNCKIILSHAEGTLPYIVNRAASFCRSIRCVTDKTEEYSIEEKKAFYADVSLSEHEPQSRLLKDFAEPGHVLFGTTDYPWQQSEAMSAKLAATEKVYAEETRQAVLRLISQFPK